MALESMAETRKRGDSKRLEALRSLAEEATKFTRLTDQIKKYLTDKVVAAAAGLTKDSSRKTFRLTCEKVLNLAQGEYGAIEKLADKMWQERKVMDHSKYHIVDKIITRVSSGKPLSAIEKTYDLFGDLY